MQVRSHALGDIPRRSARRCPDKIAVVDGAVRLTFVEFDELVDRAAGALRDNGFAPGNRIALLARNCWQYAVLAFATARAAVVFCRSISCSRPRRSPTSSVTARSAV
jgi:fatty-acyl-CoA synthase